MMQKLIFVLTLFENGEVAQIKLYSLNKTEIRTEKMCKGR
jgi:hypothetical protein